MADVNVDRLREIAGHLKDAVRRLREIGQTPREAFLQNWQLSSAARYLLIVAAEAVLDICNHLAARRGARSPRDYPDCLVVLAEIGAIDPRLEERLVRMARFRNLLVHVYANVNDGEVYRVIHESLGDLEEYLLSVGRYLKVDIGQARPLQ